MWNDNFFVPLHPLSKPLSEIGCLVSFDLTT